jgi:hypothetical protein
MIAPLVEFLEVAMRTGEADAGWAALESVKLAEETSGEWLGRSKNEKGREERTYAESLGKVEAGERNELHTRFLGRIDGSAFLRSRRRQRSLGVVGDVGAVTLVQREGDHEFDILFIDETWKGVKRERWGRQSFTYETPSSSSHPTSPTTPLGHGA